jgi:hypothetical protein
MAPEFQRIAPARHSFEAVTRGIVTQRSRSGRNTVPVTEYQLGATLRPGLLGQRGRHRRSASSMPSVDATADTTSDQTLSAGPMPSNCSNCGDMYTLITALQQVVT